MVTFSTVVFFNYLDTFNDTYFTDTLDTLAHIFYPIFILCSQIVLHRAESIGGISQTEVLHRFSRDGSLLWAVNSQRSICMFDNVPPTAQKSLDEEPVTMSTLPLILGQNNQKTYTETCLSNKERTLNLILK